MRIRTRTPHRAFSGAAVAALLLATCSDAGEPSRPPTPVIVPEASTAPPDADPTSSPPDVAPATEQPPPPTATSTPPEDTGTTTAPSAEAGDGPPEIPEVAGENSAQGAEAYAVAYIETIGYLGAYPAVEPLESFSVADSCELCRRLAEENLQRVTEGTRTDKPVFDVGEADTVVSGDGASLLIDVEQLARTDYDADGQVINTSAGADMVVGVDLSWTGSAWHIDDFYRAE